MRGRAIRVLTPTIPLFLLTACSTTGLSSNDQAAIYAAVARQLYTEERSFPVVYLVGYNDFTVVEDDNVEYVDIREPVRTAVVASLSDLTAEFVWIDSLDDPVITRVFQNRENRDAFFTLGSIELQDDGAVQVLASLYFASAGGFGTTYFLENVNGQWQITGRTGQTWGS